MPWCRRLMGMASTLSAHSHHSSSSRATTLRASACQCRWGLSESVRDGLLAIFMALLAQVLIAGIQLGLDREGSDFPAPILAMAGVFVLFSSSSWFIPAAEDFYRRRLRRPVSASSFRCPCMLQALTRADGTPESPHVDWLHCPGCHAMPRPSFRRPQHRDDCHCVWYACPWIIRGA